MKRLENDNPRVIKAIEMYLAGNAVKPICIELKMDSMALRNILQSRGILRSRNEAGRIGKGISSLNDDCLDILTPEALYWIGFLYADGHIEKDRPRTVLTLAEKDIDHLVKYKTFFGDDLVIREIIEVNKKPAPGQINPHGKQFRVSFSSTNIYNRLKDLGFTHKKTLVLDPHPTLKYSRDFWRGVVDGDGWVCMTGDTRANGKYDYACIGLSGTIDTIQEFIDYLNINEVDTKSVPRKRSRHNVYQLDLNGTKAVKAMHLLYKDSTIYLERKYNAYITITNNEK